MITLKLRSELADYLDDILKEIDDTGPLLDELRATIRMAGGRMTLTEFLASPTRNAWIKYEDASVYLRKSRRMIDDRPQTCIDIANIAVDHPRTGTFTRLVTDLQKTNLPLFVENTYEEFAISLRRHGWIDHLADPPPGYFCLYLRAD